MTTPAVNNTGSVTTGFNFDQIDALGNQGGFITTDEAQASGNQFLISQFDSIDTNDDQKITKDEISDRINLIQVQISQLENYQTQYNALSDSDKMSEKGMDLRDKILDAGETLENLIGVNSDQYGDLADPAVFFIWIIPVGLFLHEIHNDEINNLLDDARALYTNLSGKEYQNILPATGATDGQTEAGQAATSGSHLDLVNTLIESLTRDRDQYNALTDDQRNQWDGQAQTLRKSMDSTARALETLIGDTGKNLNYVQNSYIVWFPFFPPSVDMNNINTLLTDANNYVSTHSNQGAAGGQAGAAAAAGNNTTGDGEQKESP